ncbi:Proline iminopeptidase [Cyphellophora attinorum]|uniref:Proline iminopeptidase n=1 Tax=Cyphellophora attinorum TaxID=1664694 RepID=A0A0N1P1S1_9EURO|nr:Proline iminopeptidase [Phialophora attinorum]KPI42696.1 Proline iminopeptidase [Phialophora attinorum]
MRTQDMDGYTHSSPFDEGFVQAGEIHKVYYAQHGKPDGKPVIFLHGGPGGGTSLRDTRYFDPSIYRVVLIDQRGAGKSTPLADVRENTTQLLIEDIETLRQKLQITQWDIVFGGSWGSTLSLAYAEAQPEVCKAVVLRGIFLGVEWEFDWTLRGTGPAILFPDAWEKFVGHLGDAYDGKDPVKAYEKLLFSDDEKTRVDAAREWNRWELGISNLVTPGDVWEKLGPEHDGWNLQHARIECHYFMNGCFLRGDKLLLREENVGKLRKLEVYIVQGRYDIVCPPKAAWALHKALPDSKLYFTQAGHSANEPATQAKLVEICDELAKR